MAEALFRKLLAEHDLQEIVGVDSAGTSDQNVGKRPHWRARQCMRKRGISIRERRARQFTLKDFEHFDRIIAMDRENLSDLLSKSRNENDRSKLQLLLHYLPEARSEDVPDPLGKSGRYFEEVCHLIEEVCHYLFEDISRIRQDRTSMNARTHA